MKTSRTSAALLALAAVPAAQTLNRLALDNGFETLAIIQFPFVGAPASSFDPDGDLYWKVYPADALRRCDGKTDLMGIELAVYDVDWSTQALWSYTINEGALQTDQTIQPVFSSFAAWVPGLSTTSEIFPNAGCPEAGYVSGWVYTEMFEDTTGAPTALLELDADGTADWAFTHYYPGPGLADMDLFAGPINECGTTGDATFQWRFSNGYPGFGEDNDEHMADWTGFGLSGYGGFSIGGSDYPPIPLGDDSAPVLSWFFDEPTLTPRFQVSPIFGVETGSGALHTPLESSGGDTTTLGVRLYSQNGANPNHVAIATLNVGSTLLDQGFGCLPFSGGALALSPLDPGFLPGFVAMGVAPFVLDPDGPEPDSAYADSPQVPAGSGPAWHFLELNWQAWELDVVTGAVVGSSQVFEQVLYP